MKVKTSFKFRLKTKKLKHCDIEQHKSNNHLVSYALNTLKYKKKFLSFSAIYIVH